MDDILIETCNRSRPGACQQDPTARFGDRVRLALRMRNRLRESKYQGIRNTFEDIDIAEAQNAPACSCGYCTKKS